MLTSCAIAPDVAALRVAFTGLVPRLERHARFYFRHVRCPGRRDDVVQEAVALAWASFVRLARRGRDGGAFVSALARYAARAVRCGRRLCGRRCGATRSPGDRHRCAFSIDRRPEDGATAGGPVGEALRDNTATPPDEQAAFRIDFAAWRATRTARERRLQDDLMAGDGVGVVARRHGLSAARLRRLRRAFRDDWRAFRGASPRATPHATFQEVA